MDAEFEEFVKSVWCLVFSMEERGITVDSDPWWGQDYARVHRQCAELLDKHHIK